MQSFLTLFEEHNHKYSWNGVEGTCECPITKHFEPLKFIFTSDHFFCWSCKSGGTLQNFIMMMLPKHRQEIVTVNNQQFCMSRKKIRQLIIDDIESKYTQAEDLLAKNIESLKRKQATGDVSIDKIKSERATYIYRFNMEIAGIEIFSQEILETYWLKL